MKFLPLVLAALLLFAFGAKAQTTNALSDVEIQGRQLVQQLLGISPVTNLMETGILQIRNSEGTANKPVSFGVEVGNKQWISSYNVSETNELCGTIILRIIHQNGLPNKYLQSMMLRRVGHTNDVPFALLNEAQIMAPFADSDFWICDLGLEFFHWPDQKIIKHETHRTRACAVLESTNPNPTAGGYSRVDTWIDNESLSPVHAEAYDANDKLLKIFDPKKIKKVNGQWELEDMEIRNVQTGSRTWIKFNL